VACTTQVDIASKLGVHYMTLRGWEIGDHIPRAEKLQKLAAIMETDAATLNAELSHWSNNKPEGL